MNSIEKRLSYLHEKKYVSLVGNCTVGIVSAIKALGLEGKKIGIPNNVCFSVPQAVFYANAVPVYIDIEPENYGLCPKSTAQTDGLSAIIAVHAYGRFCLIDQLKLLCQERGLYLIEDFAVAYGSKSLSGVAGSFGDISITSFGTGKIIDIKHGGAIFTDNYEWAKKIKSFSSELPNLDSKAKLGKKLVSKLHTEIFNTQYLEGRPVNADYFRSFILTHKKSYFFCWDYNYSDSLEEMLDELPSQLKHRRDIVNKISNRLKNMNQIRVIQHKPNDVYWRLNLLIDQSRNELFRTLLNQNHLVSTWQVSVNTFMETNPDLFNTPVSDDIGNKILNLWVNNQVDNDYVENVCYSIKEFYQ